MEEGRGNIRETPPCSCGSRHLLCGWCMSRVKEFVVKRFQRGGGKKALLKRCPVSKEIMVAEALMKEDKKGGSVWDRIGG